MAGQVKKREIAKKHKNENNNKTKQFYRDIK